MTVTAASGKGTDPAVGAKASATGSRPERPRTMRREGSPARKWGEIALFVGPALAMFFIFVVYPVLSAVRYSFYKWNGVEQFEDAEFIGLDNYRRALFGEGIFKTAYTDPLLTALSHNLAVIALSMAIQLPLALLVALMLNRKFVGRGVVRTIIFAPYVLSEVITGVMWFVLLDPNGVVTKLVQSVGLQPPSGGWFEDTRWGFWTVFFVITWKYLGLAIILFLAGLSGVPAELQEAASIDGANWWAVQRRINIPLIGPTIRIWAFLSIIGSIQLFDMVWVLNRGGTIGQYSTVASYMMDKGFYRNDFGYGSAIAVIMFLFSLVAAVAYMVFILRRDNSARAQN